MHSFLARHGYTITETLPQDASPRQYYRVQNAAGKTAMLMAADANETRIGHRIADFTRVAKWLGEIGLSAPQVIEHEGGLLLLTDLGKTDFKTAMAQGHDKAELYNLGHDVLTFLATQAPPFDLPDYYDSEIHHGHRQIIEWYIPAIRGEDNPPGLAEEYWSVWEDIEAALPPCLKGFMHIDYHVENLMWMPGEQGLKRCGLLDFQAAMHGPLPYDVVNLLEDARMDVPREIQDSILKNYDDAFRAHYRVLGTQFHCRVIGLFVKLPAVAGKMKYLEHIPRLAAYLHKGLQDPLLAPVRKFFDDLGVDFTAQGSMNMDKIKEYIGKHRNIK